LAIATLNPFLVSKERRKDKGEERKEKREGRSDRKRRGERRREKGEGKRCHTKYHGKTEHYRKANTRGVNNL
jgi:hypothetical protein